jgi:phage baseplate assembly protein W
LANFIIDGSSPYYSTLRATWPDLYESRAIIAPSGSGVDRNTGRIISGWDHVEQSIEVIFATPFHQRVLRRWVGSFVPHILGESAVPRIITRFFWAIATAIDLWEPRYRVKQVFFMGDALNQETASLLGAHSSLAAADLLRLGQAIFRQEGVYFPRGHVGDFTPYHQRQFGITGRGGNLWDVVAPT